MLGKLSLLILISALLCYWMFTVPLVKVDLDEEYTYIIVGSGSSGSVIANRLSENEQNKVLVLEAGLEETSNWMVDVPLAVPRLQQTNLDWEYKTVPQKHACKALNNQQSNWPRGKALGGTSNLNYMLYVRGNKADYNDWERMGCDGWGYKDVLPYFKKSEDNQNQEFASNMGHHSKNGPLTVSDISVTSLADTMMKAFQQLGYRILDVNGKNQLGVMKVQATIRKGQRWSTAKAFLRPAMSRKNLHVATKAHVQKILIEGKKAKSVKVIHNGKPKIIKVKKEIVLSAGTVGSAQLLMLSGVGPREHLKQLKIPVIADLPVGNNLQDHLCTDMLTFLVNTSDCLTQKNSETLAVLMQFFLFGTGVSISAGGIESIAFSKVNPDTSEGLSDIQFHNFATHFGTNDERLVEKNLNIKENVFSHMYGHLLDTCGVLIAPTLLRPKSTGTIRLKSTDPQDDPLIDPQYLSQPQDVETLLKGVKEGLKLLETPSMKSVSARLNDRVLPGCEMHTFLSDDYIRCYIQHMAIGIYHPVGTCKMGKASDKTSVVDPQLRVIGIEGLRVADASIMPQIVSGNTNAPCIMIGEKASDLIKNGK